MTFCYRLFRMHKRSVKGKLKKNLHHFGRKFAHWRALFVRKTTTLLCCCKKTKEKKIAWQDGMNEFKIQYDTTIQDLKQSLNMKTREVRVLNEEKKVQGGKTAEMEEIIRELNERLNKKSRQLLSYEKGKGEMVAQISKYREECKSMKAECAALRQSLQDSELSARAMRDECEVLGSARRQTEDLEHTCTKLKEQLRHYKIDMYKKDRLLAEKDEEIAAKEADVRQKQALLSKALTSTQHASMAKQAKTEMEKQQHHMLEEIKKGEVAHTKREKELRAQLQHARQRMKEAELRASEEKDARVAAEVKLAHGRSRFKQVDNLIEERDKEVRRIRRIAQSRIAAAEEALAAANARADDADSERALVQDVAATEVMGAEYRVGRLHEEERRTLQAASGAIIVSTEEELRHVRTAVETFTSTLQADCKSCVESALLVAHIAALDSSEIRKASARANEEVRRAWEEQYRVRGERADHDAHVRFSEVEKAAQARIQEMQLLLEQEVSSARHEAELAVAASEAHVQTLLEAKEHTVTKKWESKARVLVDEVANLKRKLASAASDLSLKLSRAAKKENMLTARAQQAAERMRRKMMAEHEETTAALTAKLVRAEATAKRLAEETDRKISLRVEETKQYHQKILSQQERDNARKLEAMRWEHTRKMESLRETYEARMLNIQGGGNDLVRENDKKWRATVRSMEQQMNQERATSRLERERLEKQWENNKNSLEKKIKETSKQLANVKDAHVKELESRQKLYDRKLAKITEDETRRREEATAKLEKEWNTRYDRLESEASTKIKQLELTVENLESQHVQELTTVKSQVSVEVDQLRHKLVTIKDEAQQEADATWQSRLEELRLRLEVEVKQAESRGFGYGKKVREDAEKKMAGMQKELDTYKFQSEDLVQKMRSQCQEEFEEERQKILEELQQWKHTADHERQLALNEFKESLRRQRRARRARRLARHRLAEAEEEEEENTPKDKRGEVVWSESETTDVDGESVFSDHTAGDGLDASPHHKLSHHRSSHNLARRRTTRSGSIFQNLSELKRAHTELAEAKGIVQEYEAKVAEQGRMLASHRAENDELHRRALAAVTELQEFRKHVDDIVAVRVAQIQQERWSSSRTTETQVEVEFLDAHDDDDIELSGSEADVDDAAAGDNDEDEAADTASVVASLAARSVAGDAPASLAGIGVGGGGGGAGAGAGAGDARSVISSQIPRGPADEQWLRRMDRLKSRYQERLKALENDVASCERALVRAQELICHDRNHIRDLESEVLSLRDTALRERERANSNATAVQQLQAEAAAYGAPAAPVVVTPAEFNEVAACLDAVLGKVEVLVASGYAEHVPLLGDDPAEAGTAAAAVAAAGSQDPPGVTSPLYSLDDPLSAALRSFVYSPVQDDDAWTEATTRPHSASTRPPSAGSSHTPFSASSLSRPTSAVGAKGKPAQSRHSYTQESTRPPTDTFTWEIPKEIRGSPVDSRQLVLRPGSGGVTGRSSPRALPSGTSTPPQADSRPTSGRRYSQLRRPVPHRPTTTTTNTNTSTNTTNSSPSAQELAVRQRAEEAAKKEAAKEAAEAQARYDAESRAAVGAFVPRLVDLISLIAADEPRDPGASSPTDPAGDNADDGPGSPGDADAAAPLVFLDSVLAPPDLTQTRTFDRQLVVSRAHLSRPSSASSTPGTRPRSALETTLERMQDAEAERLVVEAEELDKWRAEKAAEAARKRAAAEELAEEGERIDEVHETVTTLVEAVGRITSLATMDPWAPDSDGQVEALRFLHNHPLAVSRRQLAAASLRAEGGAKQVKDSSSKVEAEGGAMSRDKSSKPEQVNLEASSVKASRGSKTTHKPKVGASDSAKDPTKDSMKYCESGARDAAVTAVERMEIVSAMSDVVNAAVRRTLELEKQLYCSLPDKEVVYLEVEG
eukprot:Rmarinus@m.13052